LVTPMSKEPRTNLFVVFFVDVGREQAPGDEADDEDEQDDADPELGREAFVGVFGSSLVPVFRHCRELLPRPRQVVLELRATPQRLRRLP